MSTEAERSARAFSERPKVALTTSHMPTTAASTPQAWIIRCAGVQKLSRPIERCQETSHAPPMVAQVTAIAPVQMYQGTADARERAMVVLAV